MFHICLVITLYIFSDVLGNVTDYRSKLIAQYPGYGTEFTFFGGKNGELIKGYFNSTPIDSRMGFDAVEDIESKIHLTLYTRAVLEGTEIRTKIRIARSTFDNKKQTKFITHGWMSSGSSQTCILMKDKYLARDDLNVFVLDWGKVADKLIYFVSAKSVPYVAKYLSDFINFLIEKFDVNPKDVHLIGHSLGAHVSGFAARGVKKEKIGRVTGLDPALPAFGQFSMVSGGHLNYKDADFVDIIHTCKGILGMEAAIGHVDFYPNGGSPPQPGCGSILEIIESCSHGRSWEYFANSIDISNKFVAYHCPSYEDFVYMRNCYGDAIPMGDPVPLTARGVYYLKTNLSLPWIN